MYSLYQTVLATEKKRIKVLGFYLRKSTLED